MKDGAAGAEIVAAVTAAETIDRVLPQIPLRRRLDDRVARQVLQFELIEANGCLDVKGDGAGVLADRGAALLSEGDVRGNEAQSELGLSAHRFPNQWSAALSAGISTAIGAFVPIIPFFFSGGLDAVIASFGISLVAHFAVGALKSLITIRSWWASGLEMTWIGIIVAVVTYGLGLAFGSLG